MKKKIGLAILVILILIVLVYLVMVIRRFVIINQIKNAISQYSDVSNYHINISNENSTEIVDGENNNETRVVKENYSIEMFFKDNSYKQIMITENDEGSTKLTYFADLNNSNAFRFDEETLRKELISMSDLSSKTEISDLASYSLVSDKTSVNILNALNIFTFHISSDENNYIIKSNEIEEYIDKNTKLLTKQVNYTNENNYSITDYEIEFDTVTNEMVNEV